MPTARQAASHKARGRVHGYYPMMNAPDEPSEEPSPPDARFPDNYSNATGKGDIHIPGAGTFGMIGLIASLPILFLGSIVALLISRPHYSQWPPLGYQNAPLPKSLWYSTLIIPFAS